MLFKITATKSSGSPYYKLVFSESFPANNVSGTLIEVKTSVAKFNYIALSDGYLSISVYHNQTESITMQVLLSGNMQTMSDNIDSVYADAYRQISVGTSARSIIIDTSTIKAKSIISYEGGETPVTWPGGMAIWKNVAVIGYNSGYFALFDILTGALIAMGQSAETESHNNNLFFDTGSIINGYPLLYASHCKTNKTDCYVYALSVTGLTLTLTKVQTITYSGTHYENYQTVDWSYDSDKNQIIALISKNDAPCTILCFNKPIVFFENIVLTDEDIISVSFNEDITVRQGSVVINSYLFVLNGFSQGNIYVINPVTGVTINTISLTPMDNREPEGIAFANGKVYINMHHGVNRITAYLYELTF